MSMIFSRLRSQIKSHLQKNHVESTIARINITPQIPPHTARSSHVRNMGTSIPAIINETYNHRRSIIGQNPKHSFDSVNMVFIKSFKNKEPDATNRYIGITEIITPSVKVNFEWDFIAYNSAELKEFRTVDPLIVYMRKDGKLYFLNVKVGEKGKLTHEEVLEHIRNVNVHQELRLNPELYSIDSVLEKYLDPKILKIINANGNNLEIYNVMVGKAGERYRELFQKYPELVQRFNAAYYFNKDSAKNLMNNIDSGMPLEQAARKFLNEHIGSFLDEKRNPAGQERILTTQDPRNIPDKDSKNPSAKPPIIFNPGVQDEMPKFNNPAARHSSLVCKSSVSRGM